MTEQLESDKVELEGQYQQPRQAHKVCKTIKEVGKLLLWLETTDITVQTGLDKEGKKAYIVGWFRQ